MDTSKFRGTWTALITPFIDDEHIDYNALERLIERQIEGDVTGILVIGTTGESPTLREDEQDELIRRAKQFINGRCLLMAGCGTNNTTKSVKRAKVVREAGADILMAVNPYYNKPTQEGLYRHFKAISEATDLPLVVYNIKGRTSVNVETNTLMRLAIDAPNIVVVKEASGDLDQIRQVCKQRPEGFIILSGDDGITFEMIEKFGADGVISVASNIVPGQISAMVRASLNGDLDKARDMDKKLQPLFKTLFAETNPIPVKYAAYKMGLCKLVYRLPMCGPSRESQQKVDEMLIENHLI